MTTSTSKRSKRTTAADIAAAVALGAIDPDASFTDGTAEPESAQVVEPIIVAVLPSDAHQCGIPGCRHGAAHGATVQPDRQLKLAAECGAVARMTARALATAGGSITDGHGHPFAVAARRTYTRKS